MATKFSKETYLYWYELMQLIRQFELTAEEKYKMEGKIRGFFHAYVGQEAIAAGCMTATKPEDAFITAYRDHGLALAKGDRSFISPCARERRVHWAIALLRH